MFYKPGNTLRTAGLLLALLVLLPLQAAWADAYRFSGVERVVAVGDVHGALEELVIVLRGTGLIDEELNWSGGRTHLVSIGDLLNRGDYGRQVMDLMMRIAPQAAAAGGAVHVVLGNHESMNLAGDLRYVSEGDYAQFGTAAPPGLPPGYLERRAAFAPDGEYGRWLLGLPVAIIIDDVLFIHAGLSTRLEGLSLEQINVAAKRDIRRVAEGWHALRAGGQFSDTDDFGTVIAEAPALAQSEDPAVRRIGEGFVEALDGLPFIPDGPLWYRGSVRCHPFVETEVAGGILGGLGARTVVVGHTPTHDRRVTSRLDGRVIGLDTGLNRAVYQGRPAALVIREGELSAWYDGEGELPVEAEPNRIWDRPHGMSDAEIEAFLLSAEVVELETAGAGGHRRVTLEQDGRRLTATFNTRDTAPRVRDGRWPRGADRADRYSHEIAAYRLDRLLGLNMVPVTVERILGEERGALRLWIEGSVSEQQRQAGEVRVRSDCPLTTQFKLMNVFDVLTFNPDHDHGSMRYDPDGQLWLLDQSRAFGTTRDVPGMLRRSGLKISPQMAEALAVVTAENAASLMPYLHPRQVEALVDRARQLRTQR
jgi:hypothetical protein